MDPSHKITLTFLAKKKNIFFGVSCYQNLTPKNLMLSQLSYIKYIKYKSIKKKVEKAKTALNSKRKKQKS